MTALHKENKRIIIAVLVTCIFSWIFSYIAIKVFTTYAVGLFIWLPIVIGVSSTVIFGYKKEVTKSDCRSVTFLPYWFFVLAYWLLLLKG